MTAEHHVPRVTALIAVIFIMQRLVQVADEMDHEFEGPGARDSASGGWCRAELRSAPGGQAGRGNK